MAYASVWLNGKFVGGWPYGYASFRLDLTPYVEFGAENVLADPAGQSARLFALVSRWRDLSQCLAGEDRAGSR